MGQSNAKVEAGNIEQYTEVMQRLQNIITQLLANTRPRNLSKVTQVLAAILATSSAVEIQKIIENARLPAATNRLLQQLGARSLERQSLVNKDDMKRLLKNIDMALMADNPFFAQAVDYDDRLKVASQITHPLLMKMLLDNTVPAITLTGEGAELKIKWLNQFMAGQMPNLNERDQSRSNAQDLHMQNPTEAQAKNPTELLRTFFSNADEKALAKLAKEHETKKAELESLAVESKLTSTIAPLLQGANAIKQFFTAENAKIPVHHNFVQMKIYPELAKKANKQPSYALTEKDGDNIYTHLNQLLEADKALQNITRQKDLPSVKEANQMKVKFILAKIGPLDLSAEQKQQTSYKILEATANLREAKHAFLKYADSSIKTLNSELHQLTREIKDLHKKLKNRGNNWETLQNDNQNLQTRIDQLQDQLRYLTNAFPSNQQEREEMRASFKKVFHRLEDFSTKLNEQMSETKDMTVTINTKLKEQRKAVAEALSVRASKQSLPQDAAALNQIITDKYEALQGKIKINENTLNSFYNDPKVRDNVKDEDIQSLVTDQLKLKRQVAELETKYPQLTERAEKKPEPVVATPKTPNAPGR